MMRSWEHPSPCFYNTAHQTSLSCLGALDPITSIPSILFPTTASYRCPSISLVVVGPLDLPIYTIYTAKPFPRSILAFNQSHPFFLPIFLVLMALLLLLLPSLLLLSLLGGNAQPPPGYYPSHRFRPLRFYHGFSNLWGPQHQYVSRDQSSVTIWLDRNSGSGFKSNRPFRNGYFSTSIKLQRGYTAGVITAFYLSNNEAHPGFHDEVDIEFLGTMPGKPYTLQTNVYIRGSGDGRIIGREMKFHLWFDPTAGFHNYAVLWSSREIM